MQLVCLRQRAQTALDTRAHDTKGPLTPLLSAAVATSVNMFALEGAELTAYLAGTALNEQREAKDTEPNLWCVPCAVQCV